jgi:hypothetical protein
MRRSSVVTARIDRGLRDLAIELRRQHPEVPAQELRDWLAMRAMHSVGADADATRTVINKARYVRRQYPRSLVESPAARRSRPWSLVTR